jgi:hypothetical protein
MKIEKRGFCLLSVIKRNKEQMIGIKLYIQRNCRTYYANLHNSDIKPALEEFIKKIMIHLIKVSTATKLLTFNSLLAKFTRDPQFGQESTSNKLLKILGVEKYKFMEFFKYKLLKSKSSEIAQKAAPTELPGIRLAIPSRFAIVEQDDQDGPSPKKATSRFSKPKNPTKIFSEDFSNH